MKLHEPPSRSPSVEQILARPAGERVREFKYRFAQSVVFGLPVLALHWFGPALGGPEAPRWTGLLQTLLAGWVIYVAAGGMIFEGALLLLLARGRITADFVVATIAAIGYAWAVAAWAVLLLRGDHGRLLPVPFHYSILLLVGWCGVRWAWLCFRKQG